MIIASPRVARILTAVALSTGVTACDADRTPMPTAPDMSMQQGALEERHLTVYSHNVYLGGDTGPLLSLDFGDLPALLAATGAFWNQVTSSDPEGRMAAIVDAMEARRPHLVALQEVFDFTVLDFSTGTPRVAARVDLLETILTEVDRRSLPYELVAAQANTTTGPTSGLPLGIDAGAGTVTSILQFTDRIAVLRRTDVDVTPDQGRYAADFQVGPLTLSRGWIRVSMEHGGVPHHLITTHLEVQALAPVQTAQAQELLASVTAGLDGVTIVAGDLNSDAAAQPGDPSWTPTYETFLDAGFTDAWVQSGQPAWDDGLTCCQDPDLRNGSSGLAERIDFVLVRHAGNPSRSGFVPGSIRLDVVGENASDRTDGSSLWPSDHAGLVASLMVAPGLGDG